MPTACDARRRRRRGGKNGSDDTAGCGTSLKTLTTTRVFLWCVSRVIRKNEYIEQSTILTRRIIEMARQHVPIFGGKLSGVIEKLFTNDNLAPVGRYYSSSSRWGDSISSRLIFLILLQNDKRGLRRPTVLGPTSTVPMVANNSY